MSDRQTGRGAGDSESSGSSDEDDDNEGGGEASLSESITELLGAGNPTLTPSRYLETAVRLLVMSPD